MTLSSYRGISWVSHKRESSLSSLPTASPPSARNSSKTTSSPEAHSEKRPESPTPAPEVPLNDDSLKNLYGIRTVAMRRHSSHSVTSSVSNSSSAKPKSTTSESSTQGDVEASSPQRHATSKTSTVQSTTHSLPSPSAPDDLRALTPLAHHDHQRTDVLAEPPTDTTASNPTNVETPLRQSASLPIPSTSKSEDCSPPVHSQSLKSADTLTPFDPPSADSQPSLSKRSPVVKILQQKRRMASAPFFNKAPDFPHPTLTPPSGVLQLPDTSSDIPPPSSSRKPPPHVLPFYGRSARRARSRHPSRNNSETPPPSADVSTPASSSSRMPSSFSVSDLRPIRTQNLSSQELHGQLLSPREVVMTPTTEEWRSYGGKVGSSRLALRQRPRRQEGEEEGDTSRVSTPSSSDEEEAEDYVQMAHRSRRKSTNQDQLNQFETTSTRAHKPPERPKLRPRVIDGSQLSSGLALIDIPGLNRTVSAEHAGASLGPISLLTTGPIDPKRYSAITGLRNINSFTVERDAGAGAYGSVVQAREISTGLEIIIKSVVKQRILADCWKKHKILGPIPVEIHVLDQLRRIPYSSILSLRPSQGPPPQTGHPTLCSLIDFWEDQEHYYLSMPTFGKGQDLFDHVDEYPDGLPLCELRSILGQIISGVAFLHSNGIVHRDIKDENVILDGKGNAALIDFGSAAYFKEGQLFDTFSGTLDFAAPEVLRGERYDARMTDVWAFGVLAYVLICGECPFWHSDEAIEGLKPRMRASAVLDDKVRLQPDFEIIVDLVRRCVEVEAAERPTAEAICRHAFFGNGGWSGRLGWRPPTESVQH